MLISSFFIYNSSIIYLVIPIIFFFFGWLRWEVGLLLSALLLISVYVFYKKVKNKSICNELFRLSKEHFIAFIILFLFLLSTGNTGFIGCWSTDIPWRNAIYQDLIRQSWPVIYDYSNSMLCYYMVFWLVPAEITSLLHLSEFGSNIVLFLWMYAGLILIFFLLCDILKPQKDYIILVTVLFCLFSGINTVGMILKSFFFDPTPLITDYPSRESWSFSDYNIRGSDLFLIIRSFYLCLADVYNQFFAIAISSLLFLKLRNNTEFYAFIGLLILPYSPIGFLGFFAVAVIEFIVNIFKTDGIKQKYLFFTKSLSVSNICASISILPIFYFYFFMNTHASALLVSGYSEGSSYLSIPVNKFGFAHVVLLFFYYYLYFLIYARLIYDSFKNDSLFWALLLCLIVFPFFKIGKGGDFNFNATICPYILLFVFIVKHLLNKFHVNNFKIKDLILVSCLSIAMLTPITQIATSFRGAYLNGSISYRDVALNYAWSSDLLKDSFRDKDINSLENFLVRDYKNKVFYAYFARKQVK